ncbi:MAG TPA: AAA family ATPase [Blastocatellia bacterium]|nr:AAA family ATPase [Blastocatellia bacterium]HMV83063.1 AAA family ATPase [Blastocatellia bacterium]HMX25417.1 AAA family ATPase [Blastocatellia bacterium]HMZ17748.1 AAA family ATPase [Blastocatellia bacterium]HNG33775.1 AAA family ATPase [Blastocatellia bacterium]
MQTQSILQPEEINPAIELANRVLAQLDRILLGRAELHRLVLTGIFSRGHILLEGLPGVGKTALVKALGDLLGLEFKRVQFTPDLMPSDILGTHILQENADGRRAMEFHSGPIFTNLLLADEINRASPKTQSALLEAMQERAVTLLGATRELPDPFFVLASQNPIELEGTYPLPEAQLDRFLFKLNVGGADVETLDQIISSRRRGQPPQPEFVVSAEELQRIFAVMDRIYLPKPVSRYISRIVAATHADSPEAPNEVKSYVAYGASPRAAIAMAEAARAYALLAGRPTVGFEDVKAVAAPVLNHRLVLNYKAKFDGFTPAALVAELLGKIDETGIKLPKDVELH